MTTSGMWISRLHCGFGEKREIAGCGEKRVLNYIAQKLGQIGGACIQW